jgi:hypothetical protein
MSTNILHHIRVAPDKKRGHEFTSRDGEAPELLLKATLEETRAQGRPGAGRTRSLVCSKKAHELVTTGSTETSGLPCAMVLTLLRALPGVRDLIVTVACKSSFASLAPAQGRQDHTTSSSAMASHVGRCHPRPSHPASRVVTIAIRPSCRGGTAWVILLILGSDKAKYFL